VLETQHGAEVRAPITGTVVYAGEFRSYGKLVTIAVGCATHVMIAGLGNIAASVGERIGAGQTLGTTSQGQGEPLPVIYLEVRRDGQPTDPGLLTPVTHPGTAIWLDKLGYAATGSGAIHATMRLSLGAQTRQASLAETLYRVYEAKRASEVAPGVGQATDVAVIEQGKVSHCDINLLGKLKEAFDTSQKEFPDLGGVKQAMGDAA
jgi:hypothetical protein